MKEIKPFETWIIRHKETKSLWQAPSGKTSWKAKNHAACAWSTMTEWSAKKWDIELKDVTNLSYRQIDQLGYNHYGVPKFSKQDRYELVKLNAEPSVVVKEKQVITLHVPESGEWTVAYLGDKCFYSGDDYARPMFRELCEELGIEINTIEYSQEEYESKFE